MKRILSTFLLFIAFIMAFEFTITKTKAEVIVTEESIYKVAEDIISWKKADVHAKENESLFNSEFLKNVGTTTADWYPIGMGRLGIDENYSAYLGMIFDNVQRRYNTPDKLDKAKSTEWHRIILSILSSGGNPRAIGNDLDGDGRGDIDLVADGTYNRVSKEGIGILGSQGINGFIWGLIALDSRYYQIPTGSFYTRDDIILNIINRQKADGGWGLMDKTEKSDSDITGMALQALAPYYNSEKEYTYTNNKIQADGRKITKKVRQVVDEAIKFLSKSQSQYGDYISWGMPNCESTIQVATGLCSLGIDIFQDERFIKDNNTLYDGILRYKMNDGGFIHSFIYDSENPGALPETSNSMASEQALYCMSAILRNMNRQRRLYDFRPEQSREVKEQIRFTEDKINTLTQYSTKQEIQDVYNEYLKIEGSERSYVRNYKHLSELLDFSEIPYVKEEVKYNSGDAGVIVTKVEFTEKDRNEVDSLPEKLSTKEQFKVLSLLTKIQNSFDFNGKEEYIVRLEKAKNEIEKIFIEIEDIKKEIKETLYAPKDESGIDNSLQWLGLDKRNSVHELYNRYLSLSDYDRTMFEESDIEALMKCKTHVDNLFTSMIIGISCSIIVLVLVIVVIIRVKKRAKAKTKNQMEESDD